MKAKFIYEAIRHLAPKNQAEIEAVVEKEDILDQLKLLQHHEYGWLRAKLFSEKNIKQTKKKIREAVEDESREGELGQLYFLRQNIHEMPDLQWLYTETYNKLIKKAKTTNEISAFISEACQSWEWNNWKNSQNLSFPPIVEILLKRAKQQGLNVIDEDVYSYMYQNKIDITEYVTKFTDNNFNFKRIDNNMFNITFNEWSDFAPYFDESKDIDEKFIEAVLSGEGDEYFFGYRRDKDWPDFSSRFLKQIEKSCFEDLKKVFSERHSDIEIPDNIVDLFEQMYELEREGKLDDDIRSAIVKATNETAEMADSEQAFEELKEAIINYFELNDVKYVKDKWVGRIHKTDLAKFMAIQYIPDVVDKKIDYTPPYYGYQGDAENHPDIFIDCLANALDDL